LKKEAEEDARRWKNSPMLRDWQNQYCENGYNTGSNIDLQCNACKNSNVILYGKIKDPQ
jgi:hypothetical protein